MPNASRRGASTAEVDCAPTVLVGHLVRYDADNHVDVVDVYDGTKMPVRALVIGKPSATRALIQFSGPIPEGVLGGLSVGVPYYAGAGSVPSTSPPAGPLRRYTQHIGFATSPSTLVLLFQNPTIMVSP